MFVVAVCHRWSSITPFSLSLLVAVLFVLMLVIVFILAADDGERSLRRLHAALCSLLVLLSLRR